MAKFSAFSATALTACTIAVLCSGGPAAASASPTSVLDLSLRGSPGTERAVLLTCTPDSGTHPGAGEACTALERADGDFTRLSARKAVCTMVHSPVRAEATGHWRGKPVEYSTEYGNPCLAEVRSGGVFAF